ncbi:hypothetical protein DDB_G0276715 [Dictyostelium discoideum AX4]|uniref:hypothetical protein n=1 Tax=Dictyostelium discoideum AX4 TaxID=352472 RepID=UPI00004E2BA4|nr:hypothetical protein DDB_G0276715 [Dictyostelium discoideum AX4]EAL69115.1 hypothetical protein DDB_G0276715 [Dictyostelium discoideum AX4]|eukprot:XP_643027.1 hypothetical protein DDB_G0276715 [Dictyostelium discoideum AX4]
MPVHLGTLSHRIVLVFFFFFFFCFFVFLRGNFASWEILLLKKNHSFSKQVEEKKKID